MNEEQLKHKELCKQAMTELKEKIKKSSWRYADIADHAGISTNWTGRVLNGAYPYSGAYRLPKNVRLALQSLNFDVPEILWTF